MVSQRIATNDPTDPRRRLPAVSVLLDDARVQALVETHTRPVALGAIQAVLSERRQSLQPGARAPSVADLVEQITLRLHEAERDRLRPVVNATGILLHTGLGRAVLPQAAVDALSGLSRCCNLQIDLDTGLRGKRNATTEALLTRLTGAEAALVVNNNAAATLLILTALCSGREVVVSRGQLIEIGGSYRLPDCIHQIGAIMVEVGTTNKTHLRDYEAALSENTSALLRVNPSNYRVVGFSKQVPIADLVSLKEKQPVLVIDDLGCGALLDLTPYGLPPEPTAPDSIAAGADIACFSGDKLIGGPQAGIIVGKTELVAKIRKHPLTRMLRVGKLTDMALERTLRLFLNPDKLTDEHPTLAMLTASPDALKRRATALRRRLQAHSLSLECSVVEGESAVGGGSLPTTALPTYVLALTPKSLSAAELCRALRLSEPPVIARVRDDAVLLDMRTLLPGDAAAIVQALQRINAAQQPPSTG